MTRGWHALGAIWLCCSVAASLPAQSRPPNILFLFADDVGQEVLECYGGQSYSTPHLNELARTGMKFHNAFSMPVCHPSRTTLMTGKYPFRHGQVRWGDFPKDEETRSLARRMQRAGYETAIAGKWQLCLLGDDPFQPKRLGFDQWDLFGWHEGPRFYEPMIYRNGEVREDTQGHYGPDLYQRALIDFMKANRERPFMAFYSMALAHEVTDDLDPPVPHGPFDRYDSYAEMISELDRAVGRMVGALDALGLRDSTLILFLADNGTPPEIIIRADGNELIKTPVASRCNGLLIPGGKKQLTNAGTNVPMIANWPGVIQPGLEVDDIVDFSDLLPTLLDLAGTPVKEDDLDGYSFASRLRGQGTGIREFAYCEEATLPKPGGTEPDGESSGLKWVRNKAWKLYNDGRLFHMTEDPYEQYPLSAGFPNETQTKARQELEQAFRELGL